jgi:hypothetical protein
LAAPVASPALLAASLLGRPLSSLEHAAKDYPSALARTRALDYLERRAGERSGFEIAGYDDTGFAGFYLKVPLRRAPILVGPDEHRDVPVDFWALDRVHGPPGNGKTSMASRGRCAGRVALRLPAP